MTEYVDAHCHLDLFANYEETARKAESSQTAVIAVTTIPRAWRRNMELSKQFANVTPALGLHPQLVADYGEEIGLFVEYLSEAHFVGEVGLDATARYYSSFDQQKKVFHHILSECAKEGNKVLSVHSVRTAKIVLDMIEDSQLLKSDCKVILHWFTGGIKEAHRAMQLGCYFSINFAMLAKSQHSQVIKDVPIGRILTESDGPFAQFNNNPILPSDMIRLVELIASLRGDDTSTVRTAIAANYRSLL